VTNKARVKLFESNKKIKLISKFSGFFWFELKINIIAQKSVKFFAVYTIALAILN